MSQPKKSVIDLLNFLSYDEESKFLPQNKNFNYKKIGKATIEKHKDESDKVDFDIEYDENGYSFEHITFNRDRANVSVRVKYNGNIKLPKNGFGILGVETFMYRAYSLITDGKLNVNILPIIPSQKLITFLTENCIEYTKDENVILVNMSPMLILSTDNIPSFTSSKLATLEMDLFCLQAMRKYLNHTLSGLPNSTTAPTDVEIFLKNFGISQSNGYRPKTESVDSDGGSYTIKTLKTKISSLSNLPSVESVYKKMGSNKPFTPSENILHDAMKQFDGLISKELGHTSFTMDYKLIKDNYTTEYIKSVDLEIKSKLFQISQIVFYILVTGNWFCDKEVSDNILNINHNDKVHTVTFEISTELVGV